MTYLNLSAYAHDAYTHDMNADTTKTHYTLLTRRDAIPDDYEGELVRARRKNITVMEVACAAPVLKEELTRKMLRNPDVVYCIEEACCRAVECMRPLPVVLHHGSIEVELTTHEQVNTIARSAFGSKECIELCLPIYKTLK